MSSLNGANVPSVSGAPPFPAPSECLLNSEICLKLTCCIPVSNKSTAFQWTHYYISKVAWESPTSSRVNIATCHGVIDIPTPLHVVKDKEIYTYNECLSIPTHLNAQFQPHFACPCVTTNPRGNVKLKLKRLSPTQYKVSRCFRESLFYSLGLLDVPTPNVSLPLYASFAPQTITMNDDQYDIEYIKHAISTFDLHPHISNMCSEGKSACLQNLQVPTQSPNVLYQNDYTNTSILHTCINPRSSVVSSPLQLAWSVSEAEFHEYDYWRRGTTPSYTFATPYTGKLNGLKVNQLKQDLFALNSTQFGAYVRPRFPNGHNHQFRNTTLVLHTTKSDDSNPQDCEASLYPGMCMVFFAFPTKAEKLGLVASNPQKSHILTESQTYEQGIFSNNMEYQPFGSMQPLISVEKTQFNEEKSYNTGSNVANSYADGSYDVKPSIICDFLLHMEDTLYSEPTQQNGEYIKEHEKDIYTYKMESQYNTNTTNDDNNIDGINLLVLTWKRTLCVLRLTPERSRQLLPFLKPGACLWLQSLCSVRPLSPSQILPLLSSTENTEKNTHGQFHSSNSYTTLTLPQVAGHRSLLVQLQLDMLEEQCVENQNNIHVTSHGGKLASLFYQSICLDMTKIQFLGNAFVNKKHTYMGLSAGEVFLNGHAREVVPHTGKWGYPGYSIDATDNNTEEEKQELSKHVVEAEEKGKSRKKFKTYFPLSNGVLDEAGQSMLFANDQEEEVQMLCRVIPELQVEIGEKKIDGRGRKRKLDTVKKLSSAQVEPTGPSLYTAEELAKLERGREKKALQMRQMETSMASAPFVWFDMATAAEQEEAQHWRRDKRLDKWIDQYTHKKVKKVAQPSQYHVDWETGVTMYSNRPIIQSLVDVPDCVLPFHMKTEMATLATWKTKYLHIKQGLGWMYQSAVEATREEIEAGIAYISKLTSGEDVSESTSDQYYAQQHAPHEMAEKTQRGDRDNEWAICEGCGKWRVYSGAIPARFYCGGMQRNVALCNELDDWIVRCQRGDTILAKQLADLGCHTVEGQESKTTLLNKMRQQGVIFEISQQTLKRLQ